ncbi:MAG: class I SAM-dependent methyltransferase [Verrucomicrobia bacterium]|jgi:2-polyprenyl-3-methyl-5-hydroxy-6-metoxy-1,4-benzoquinol methylase|nr:class I SAM-dependent methyltransferase [Verrucomicrobiota bacterium]MDB4746561.1 class I SAM-dependent methyltransferase [Verrucomicrobiota bacterium]
MIIHRLIARHLQHGDDSEFYRIQASDSIAWLQGQGVVIAKDTQVLDLGCGHGIFGKELSQHQCDVHYADQTNDLAQELKSASFFQIDLDKDPYAPLGSHDLVICSNVLEHLSDPDRFLENCRSILKPNGYLYLSWTNWLSPWGGHDFSPFHYLGPKTGPKVYDRLIGKKRIHTPFETLYPTYIGEMLSKIQRLEGLTTVKIVPRYYSEFELLMKIPCLREFLAWNCSMLIRRAPKDTD